MKIKINDDTVVNEFNSFSKTNPHFVELIGKTNELGSRLQMEIGNALATLAYVQKTKGTLKQQVGAYETILQRLIDVLVNVSAHGMIVTELLMTLIRDIDDVLAEHKKLGTGSLRQYVCEMRKPIHIRDK